MPSSLSVEHKLPPPHRLGFALFIGALVVYPYLFLLNIFFPSTLSIGKNTFVFVITIIIILCFLLRWKGILSKLGIGVVYFIMLLALIIISIRYWLYAEGIHKIFLYRIILMPLLYCGVAYYYLREGAKKEIVKKIIFCSCLIQAVIGLLHTYLASYIYLGLSSDRPLLIVKGATALREVGTLMNSSLYANFILLGIFILINSYKKWGLPRLVEYTIMLVLIWGVTISGSRWPFVVAILLLILYFKKLLLSKKIISVLLIIIFLGMFLPNIFILMAQQVATGEVASRIVKYHLAVSSLLENSPSFLVGPFFGRTNTTIETTSFSDNSYLLLMLTFGVPFICLFLFLFLHIIRRTISINRNYFILLYFLITLLITNSILWDIWLFYFFAALYSLQPEPSPDLYRKDVLNQAVSLKAGN